MNTDKKSTYIAALIEGLKSNLSDLAQGDEAIIRKAQELVGYPKNSDSLQGLQSILSNVGDGSESKYFEVEKLNYTTSVFAKENAPEKDVNLPIQDDVKAIQTINNESALANTLFYWMNAYGARVNPQNATSADASLFDYNRILAATVCCLQHPKFDTDTPRFLLLKGALSGIQNFIYSNINQGEVGNTKKLSKRLRGRSFYVAILTDWLAEWFVEKMDVERANIIFSGGGHFTMLLPYYENIRAEIKQLNQEFNLFLLEKIGSSLNVSVSGVECGKELFEDFREAYIKVNDQLEQQKYRRHRNYLNEIFDIVGKKAATDNESKFKDDERLGTLLPYADYLLQIKTKEGANTQGFEQDNDLAINSLSSKNTWFFIHKRKGDGKKIDAIRQFLETHQAIIAEAQLIRLNNSDFLEAADSLSHIQIPITYSFRFIGSYVPLKNQEVANFEELAKLKHNSDDELGYPQLGAMRLDVDDLGAVFAHGLKNKSHKATFARLASMSREFDLFFSGYFNELTKKYNLYTTYSGGDDAFVIGSWYNVLHFACELKEKFRAFTCGNDGISFSAGIFLCDQHYPIAKMAEDAADLEEKSKKYGQNDYTDPKIPAGKNAVSVFNQTLSWDRFTEMVKVGDDLLQITASKEDAEDIKSLKKIRRSLVHRLLGMIQAVRGHKDDMVFYQNVARVHYLVGRQGFAEDVLERGSDKAPENTRNIIDNILREFNQPDKIQDYAIPMQYVLYLTRESKKS